MGRLRRRLAWRVRALAFVCSCSSSDSRVFLVDLLKRRAQQRGLLPRRSVADRDRRAAAFVPSAWRAEIQVADARRDRDRSSIRELVEDLRGSVSRHPWVREVADVRRILPNQIALDLRLRSPVAVVDVGAWRLTIDADASCSRTTRQPRSRGPRRGSAATRSPSRASRGRGTRSPVRPSRTGSRSSRT